MLISTQELADRLSGSEGTRPIVLDARSKLRFLFRHIPGAVSVNWKEFSAPFPRVKSLLDSDLSKLEQKVGALGIDQGRPVVVYADPFDDWGEEGRICWMLSYLGHPTVQILDGGWHKWKQERRKVQRGRAQAEKARFNARLQLDLLATKEELKGLLETKTDETVIVDARMREEYLGSTSSELPREGHIPRAVNIPWNSFYNDDGTVMSLEEIRSILDQFHLDPEKQIVTYCTGGVRSAWVYFVLKLAGFEQVKNYTGSWMEWSRDLSLPIEK